MRSEPVITHHALRRYLQRVRRVCNAEGSDDEALERLRKGGVDLLAAQRELAQIIAPAAGIGAMSLVRDGFRYVFEMNCLVTVIENTKPRAERLKRGDR